MYKRQLWDEPDGFFYDVRVPDDGSPTTALPVRSLVGLLPLLGVGIAPDWTTTELPDFTERLRWLRRNRPAETDSIFVTTAEGAAQATLMAIPPERHARLLTRMLDEGEFLSPFGIRSLSAAYRGGSTVRLPSGELSITYTPGESDTGLFGGNSNWRGPVWMPVNVLLADALRVYAAGAGAGLRVEFPSGSGTLLDLGEVADQLEGRLVALFRPGPDGRRPSDPRDHLSGPLWSVHPVFSEYFHGDTGVGLGATHQTGWTALVAHLICGGGRKPAP